MMTIETARRSPRRLHRMVRPRRIIVTFIDPFDDEPVAENNYHYDARLSADVFYSRHVRKVQQALKKIQSHILQGRTPRIEVCLVAYDPSSATAR